ncbi:unnamed protein product [Ceutorhynchus assimilis]|uniref:15-hydroxyprostaglandin dehydrogenase [NAD(+)] n=1 Tax=Ceutorhynchus assimilis TaxID=467358 RepID=A0A9N9QI24_9CUCU|nr:unnamed protein product [Ceutorhynchus assimilis]
MEFSLADKVAIVTGGSSGIGFCVARELLNNGARGVTIADVNVELGQATLEKLSAEFGSNKCTFCPTDVADFKQFENAFISTLSTFGNIDILINNAGICDDSIWEKEIDVNIKGTINGVLLGLENYIIKNKSGQEGIIINLSSIRGVQPSGDRPVYAATKFAIHGMTLAWGSEDHYSRTNIKVIAVCPGSTSTPLIANPANTNLGQPYEKIRKKNKASSNLSDQTPEQCALLIIDVMKTAKSGTVWIAESAEKYQYIMPSRLDMKTII